MTSLLKAETQTASWSTMPGWGIVADLTPPELTLARQLAVLRRVVAGALVLVVLLCVGGYMLARDGYSAAEQQLGTSSDRTADLMADQAKYAGVTEVQAATDGVTTQLSTLLATDVDAAPLLTRLRKVLPTDMTLTSINLTLNPAAAVDATGASTIGTVTLTGTSHHLTELAGYVTSLGEVVGITEVIPTSNTAGTTGGSWTVTAQLTDKLYTKRFTSTPTASTDGTGGN